MMSLRNLLLGFSVIACFDFGVSLAVQHSKDLTATWSVKPNGWSPQPASELPRCKSWKSGGFSHPGIYHDCEALNRIQRNIAAGKPAFVTSLNLAINRTDAMKAANWTMLGPFAELAWAGSDGHNIPLQKDGKSVYKCTLGWYATGNTTWLERAKDTILAWSNTLEVLNEQIQGGEGLSFMTAAAEILRATGHHSGWTKADTANYNAMITRIVAPWNSTFGIARDDFFMNQGCYGNNGAMTIAVFNENRTLYDHMVRNAFVGANPDPSLDYALPIQISGDPNYYGQVTEMGRDEFHPMGTLRGLSYMGLTANLQHSGDVFSLYDNRLAAGFDYWAAYNMGNDNLPWEPKPIRPLTSTEVYANISASGRGRNYATYGLEPLEADGIAYHEFFRRNKLSEIGNYTAHMKWQGIGWDVFEFGDDHSVAYLGF